MHHLSNPTGPEVFVSYSSRDRERVGQILSPLRSAGVRLWWDHERIDGAQIFTGPIARGIKTCKAMMLMGSRASMQSRYVNKELLLAGHYGKPILPLLLEPVEIPEDFELILVGVHYIEVAPGTILQKLPSVLRALAGLGVNCPGYHSALATPRPAPGLLMGQDGLRNLMALAGWTEMIRPVRPAVSRVQGMVKRDLGGLPPEPTRHFRLGEWVALEIDVERPSHLMLLDLGTSGAVYCLCPSRFAPETRLPFGKSYLPQEGSPWEAFHISGRVGRERLLALVTEEPLGLNWLPTDPKTPARVLSQFDIHSLLEWLRSLDHDRWTALSTYFDISA